MNITVRTRAIIIYDGKLLVFKLRAADNFYSLPGGKLDVGETLEAGMARELIEETTVKPVIGRILAVQDLVLPEKDMHSIEFFFEIKNPKDYLTLDTKQATHGFEVAEHQWADLATTTDKILPLDLKEIVGEINERGMDNFEFRLIRGRIA